MSTLLPLGQATGADPFLVLLLAFAVDAAVGDPERLYRKVPHPVALLGRLISAGDVRLNRQGAARPTLIAVGAVFVLSILLVAGAVGWVLALLAAALPGGWLVEALLVSSLLAGRGLYRHVAAVADGLAASLAAARAAVGHIVGRDPDSLDSAGVARAAVESLAENFSDGVVAPAVWYLLLGLPGLCAYKALNTLDSMIGQRGPRYEAFGKAAARLDDAANLLPARLSGLLFVAAAALLPGASARGAWRALRRDAPKHRSPNAGWQEAAVAGALGFALAGPRTYGAETVEDHWMGDGTAALTAESVARALRLYLAACALLAALLAVGWAL